MTKDLCSRTRTNKDFSSKDKDCIVKDKDQDKDCILVLKDKDYNITEFCCRYKIHCRRRQGIQVDTSEYNLYPSYMYLGVNAALGLAENVCYKRLRKALLFGC